MSQALAKFIFHKLWGWKLEKTYPEGVPKSVVIPMPHTSNWDFPLGLLLRPVIGVNVEFAAKSSLFFFPFGLILKAMGGYPVDRSKHTNFVDACVKIFNEKDRFVLAIAPEGTRSKVTKLKTGFYHIAVKAGVPIVCCKFDWGTKTVGFSDPFYPTGNYEADLPKILAFFKGVKGKIPELDYVHEG